MWGYGKIVKHIFNDHKTAKTSSCSSKGYDAGNALMSIGDSNPNAVEIGEDSNAANAELMQP